MPVLLRLFLIVVITFSASSLVWFLLGATAYFQRGMDIIGTAYLVGPGILVLLLVFLFSMLLLKGWIPRSKGDYVGICIGLLFSILISVALIQSVSTNGWANEKIRSDTLKMTADQKYEYRVDLINLFQRNSNARLYLKDISSQEEMYIQTEIQSRKIVGLKVSKINHWVKLEPTDNSSLYILHTTAALGIPLEKYEINIETRTSIKLE